MAKQSAGILLFRRGPDGPLFLLVRPGGPFFAKRGNDPIWGIPKGEFDPEAEAAKGELGAPYVISFEVFQENEFDWSQETVTFYTGDDILADESDSPIYNYRSLFGELHFGYGSGDPNVVYIRNPSLRREWEVLRSTGHFAIEVLGMEAEERFEKQDLKHSNEPRKFRSD